MCCRKWRFVTLFLKAFPHTCNWVQAPHASQAFTPMTWMAVRTPSNIFASALVFINQLSHVIEVLLLETNGKGWPSFHGPQA